MMEYYGNNDWRDYKALSHYGVKGMKWGKKKSRYKDYYDEKTGTYNFSSSMTTNFPSSINTNVPYAHRNRLITRKKKVTTGGTGVVRKERRYKNGIVGTPKPVATYKPGKHIVLLKRKKKITTGGTGIVRKERRYKNGLVGEVSPFATYRPLKRKKKVTTGGSGVSRRGKAAVSRVLGRRS